MPTTSRLLAATIAAAAVTALAPPAALGAEPIKVRKAIEYGKGRVGAPQARSAPLLLDLYEPKKKAKKARPVVVVIHGGGFKQQSRTDAGIVRVSNGLAGEGIVAVSIDYRLQPQQPIPSRRVAPLLEALPDGGISPAVAAATDDTLTAIDYLKANAKRLGVDPKRIGVLGPSAGGITADHVGYVLDDHGIKGPKIRFVGSLWGGILVQPPASVRPPTANQLDRGEPALFAVHGDADSTVPVALDDQLVARARARRVRTEYHRIAGAGHGFDGSQFFSAKVVGSQTPYDRLLVFAKRQLR